MNRKYSHRIHRRELSSASLTPADELKMQRLAELRKMIEHVNRGIDNNTWSGYLRRLAKLTDQEP